MSECPSEPDALDRLVGRTLALEESLTVFVRTSDKDEVERSNAASTALRDIARWFKAYTTYNAWRRGS